MPCRHLAKGTADLLIILGVLLVFRVVFAIPVPLFYEKNDYRQISIPATSFSWEVWLTFLAILLINTFLFVLITKVMHCVEYQLQKHFWVIVLN